MNREFGRLLFLRTDFGHGHVLGVDDVAGGVEGPVINFDFDFVGFDGSKGDAGLHIERRAGHHGLVAGLDVEDPDLAPIGGDTVGPCGEFLGAGGMLAHKLHAEFVGGVIELLEIFLHLAAGVEVGADRTDRFLHAGDPLARQAVSAPFVEFRNDLFFDEIEKGLGIEVVLEFLVGMFLFIADGPSGLVVVFVTFDPPTVEDGEVDGAIDGALHAGGAGGFHGAARGVEPDIDAGDEVAGDVHVVIFDEDHAHADIFAFAEFHDVLDEALAAIIARVGFAGEDELEGTVAVGEELDEAFLIAEEERRAFVGGKAAGEADGEGLGVEDFFTRDLLSGGAATAIELHAQAIPHKGDEMLAAPFMGAPQFRIGDLFDLIPHFVIGGFVGPVGAEIARIEAGEFIRQPCLGMNAVGDGLDRNLRHRHFGPDVLPHFA